MSDSVQEFGEEEIHLEKRDENVVEESSKDTTDNKGISTGTNLQIGEQKISQVQQGQLFTMKEFDKKLPIAWLRLKNKNNTDFKPAFNDEELSTLKNKGYKIAKKFSSEEKSYIISQGYKVP